MSVYAVASANSGARRLADLYDADKRRTDPVVTRLAATVLIPHPLHGVAYADGENRCTHARTCPWPATR